MAETVTSTVVQETINQILSRLVQKYEEKHESDAKRNLERLEMAHIRLEAALEISDKWQITHSSLLRWRKKLKHAAQECGVTLHKCMQKILEDEQIKLEVNSSSLPNRIAHATKSFVTSVFSGNNNELSNSTVRRFEWFAAGASEFLRFIELGGTLSRHIPLQSLVSKLFAGKELYYESAWGNEYPSFALRLVPHRIAEHRIEASLVVAQIDANRPEGNIYFSIMLQLSESTDIIGIAIKCLHLFAPHFKCTIENIIKELTQLYAQNFPWASFVYSCEKEHWKNLHSLVSQWFRPDQLCCRMHDQSGLGCIGSSEIVGLSDISLAPVNEVTLQTFLPEDTIFLQGAPYLKVGISFLPHRFLKGILPAGNKSARVTVVGEGQYCWHRDITLGQLKESMLPKAIEYFRQNSDATFYQMVWSSEHGYAVINFKKANLNTRRKHRTFGRHRKRKLQEFRSMTHMTPDPLDIWDVQMLNRLQSNIMDWRQKENEAQLLHTQGIPYTWMLKEILEE